MSQNSVEDQGGQLLVMTVQIDDKNTARIDVFEDDEPELLAMNFCNLHKLNQRLVPILAENIKQNMIVAQKEKQNMTQYLQKLKERQITQDNQPEQLPQQNLVKQMSAQSPKTPQGKRDGNVFDRLYQSAQIKKMKMQRQDSERLQISNQLVHNQESDVNYGQLLYQRGMSKKDEFILKAEMALLEKQQQQMVECTHKPSINPISSKIVHRPQEPTCVYLNQLAKVYSEKKEQAQFHKVEEQQQQCSFHPQIDKQSQAIIEEKKKGSQIQIPHYEQLYQVNTIRQVKLNQKGEEYFTENHTFHPKIDQLSEQLVSGQSFQDRQQKYLTSIKDKQQPVDECFRPKTGRPPESRPDNLFDSLYNQAKTLADKKAQLLSSSMDQALFQSQVKASHQSDKIIQQAIYNKLANIFDLLDSDQDGEIDSLRIDISNLDPQVLQAITPLLQEMESGKHSLIKSEFIQLTSQLMTLMSNKEKHDLLKKPQKKDQSFNVTKDRSPKSSIKKN
ncbi:unnamed protein product [Paramecium octaurelia]|uniref:EF-hand domain-containing protein n=1 Tax=Paramecium octaurelia TaxID=43137 RepID=A0A8S1X9Z1_PAROT|nr:unnamed protein product [Paramecium octaurelia]